MAEPALPPEVVSSIDAWAASPLGPHAPLARAWRDTWREADRRWAALGDRASAQAARVALTQWTCRALMERWHAFASRVPPVVLSEALRLGVLDASDLREAASVFGDGPPLGLDATPVALWSALLEHAGGPAAVGAVLAALDRSRPAEPAPPALELAAVRRLADVGALDDALARMPRLEWPWHRVRAARHLAPLLDAPARQALLDATWRHVEEAPAPPFVFRVEPLAELAALEAPGGPRSLARARALAAHVEALPAPEHDVSPDHDDLRGLVALALLRAGSLDEAEAWYARIPPVDAAVAAAVAAAFPEPRRSALGLELLTRCARELRGPEPDRWLARALAEVAPAVAEACAAVVAEGAPEVERLLIRLELATLAPSSAPGALAALEAALADGVAALVERRGPLLAAVAALTERDRPRGERLAAALLAEVLEATAPDPDELRDAAAHAPEAWLPAVLDALERATAARADAPSLERHALHVAVMEAHARARATPPRALARRALALATALHDATRTAYDPDREVLEALPDAARAELVRQALRVRWADPTLPPAAPMPHLVAATAAVRDVWGEAMAHAARHRPLPAHATTWLVEIAGPSILAAVAAVHARLAPPQ